MHQSSQNRQLQNGVQSDGRYYRVVPSCRWRIRLCFTVLCVLFCHSAVFGLGKHINDVPREHIRICLRDIIMFEIMHVVTTILIKLGIGIMLLPLTSLGSLQRWIIYLTVSLYTFAGISLIFLLCFQCYPIEYFWDRTIQGSCQPSIYIGACAYVNTIVGGGTDFVLATLPIWLVWDLKLSWRTKVSIAVLLGMGNLSAAVNLVRLVHIPGLLRSDDILYEGYPFNLWSTVEAGVGICAASMTSFKPLLRSFLRALGIKSSISASVEDGLEGYQAQRRQSQAVLKRHSEAKSFFRP